MPCQGADLRIEDLDGDYDVMVSMVVQNCWNGKRMSRRDPYLSLRDENDQSGICV